MKDKIIRIASLVFIGGMIVLLLFTSYRDLVDSGTQEHLVSGGFLDLSERKDFDEPIKLDGEWEYYENVLLNDVKSIDEASKRYVTVPGEWNDYVPTRKEPKSFGYGTFHLRIQLSEAQMRQIVGLKIQNIGMSNKVLVNGQVVTTSGNPGVDQNSYEIGNVPNCVFFSPKKSEIDVLIQVSNFDYTPYSGIVSSILFGPQEVLEKTKITAFGNELLFLGASLAVGLIFLVLFIFRRKEKYLLYFSMYTLTGAFYILTHGEKIWFHLFPAFDYLLFTKLQYLSAAMNISLFLGYLYTSFPEVFKSKTTKYLAFSSLGFFPVAVFPLAFQSSVSSIQILFYIGVMLYSVYGCIKGILYKLSYTMYFVLIIFPTLFVVRESIYLVLGKGEVGIGILLAQFMWILAHALLIAVRFSKTYDLAEAQSKELVRMDQLKDEFLTKLSHELRTPLIGVSNITKLYMEQEEGSLTPAQANRLSQILDFTRRLSRLVNDMTDLSKIKEGKLALELSPIQMDKFLRDAVESMDIVYQEGGAKIVFDIQDDIPRIKADKDRIKQILFNLIENAMLSKKNNSITIGGRGLGESVKLSISYQVEPFAQQSDHTNGSALGLSIVKQLTDLMGGTIEAHPAEDGEGRISIIFPAYTTGTDRDEGVDPESQHKEEGQHRAPEKEQLSIPYICKTAGQSTIIIADESHTNLQLVADILVNHNYSVVGVDRGQDVINQIKRNPDTDLVIIDYMMQDPSGVELSRKLRELYSRDELPILMLTTTINQSDVERALLSGSNDFLYKPFQANELVARVNSLVQIKKSMTLTTSYELAFLQAQIKPHFLYNAFNTIAECCETDSREAGKLIISLSKYLRGTLDFENISSFVSVEKELALVKAYITIELARFDNLEVEFDVDEEINISLPSLTLQTLVENAVKHGATKIVTGGKVKISVKQGKDGVLFTVEDNGVGMNLHKLDLSNEPSHKRNSVGLYNINTRLVKLYGTGLTFESTLGIGTKISFLIPEGSNL